MEKSQLPSSTCTTGRCTLLARNYCINNCLPLSRVQSAKTDLTRILCFAPTSPNAQVTAKSGAEVAFALAGSFAMVPLSKQAFAASLLPGCNLSLERRLIGKIVAPLRAAHPRELFHICTCPSAFVGIRLWCLEILTSFFLALMLLTSLLTVRVSIRSIEPSYGRFLGCFVRPKQSADFLRLENKP
jgi:hypothetical protein